MRFYRLLTVVITAGVLAWALPFAAAQRGAQGMGQGRMGGGQSGAGQMGQGGARAGQGQSATSQPSRSARSANQQAADLLDTINSTQVDNAKLIASKTRNSQVRNLAQTMENEREQARTRLQAIADQSSINLQPDRSMLQERSRTRDRIQQQTASEADQTFLRAQIQEHQRVINRLRQLQGQITDPALKDYIDAEMPALQNNLQQAQQLENKIRQGSGNRNNSGQP